MTDSRYHFIGMGGIGMSGLARIALQRGGIVSGSDMRSSPILDTLSKEGAEVFIGQKASQVPSGAKIVYSTDIQGNNEEYVEAQSQGLCCLHRSAFLRELMEGFYPLLVTGTHGKTTTSSLLAHVLLVSKLDPSYSIGGFVQSLQSNAGYGRGEWFVAEADESDGSFLAYDPYGAIVTNIDLDHLNYWKNEETLLQGFKAFCQKVKNPTMLFWCADDSRLASLDLKGVSYGFSSKADLKIENASYLGFTSRFDVCFEGTLYTGIEIPLIGHHNVLNSAAVFGLCLKLGLEESLIRKAFSQFLGVQRRAEKKGEVKEITIYDDYAHHPVEIAATLSALRTASQGRRLVVLFQPHRFTRTRDCFDQFGPALSFADLVVLTDVYSAGEAPIDLIDSKTLHKLMIDQGCVHSFYLSKEELLSKTLELIKPGDVVVSMGAGDITQMGPKLLEALR